MLQGERIKTIKTTFFDQIKNIVKSAPTIQINRPLDGIVDLSILKENGFEKVKKIHFAPGTIVSIINTPNTCESIYCKMNSLTHIDLTPKLKELDVEKNNISEISLSSCPNLQKLNISHNKLETLEDLPSTLKELNCSYNELHRLDLFGLDNLATLVINNNKLISVLNIPSSSLKYIRYDENPLKEIEELATIQGLVIENAKGKVVQEKSPVPSSAPLRIEIEQVEPANMDTSNMDYKEAILKYFRLKRDYELDLKKKIRKIRNKTKNKEELKTLLSSVKGKCVVCKREVGTIFEKKDNHYIALCGDVGKNPCNLNIKIFNGEYYDFFDDMHLFKEHSIVNIHEIIKQKMDVIFNYITEKKAAELFDKNLENYSSSNSGYNILYDKYKLIYENPTQKELIHLKTEKMYEIIEKMKEREEEYKKNPSNKELLTELIEIQQNELIPTIVELRNAKYEEMKVVCDGEDDTETCKLIQREHKLDNFIYCSEQPKIIRFNV